MSRVRATTRRRLPGTAEQAYAALADYRVARPALLPAEFSRYEVLAGGTGADTTVGWTLQATRTRTRACLFTVTEPYPGRRLVETDTNSSMMVAWTVHSTEGGCEVVVVASWRGAGGVGGIFERIFAPKGLNRIHDRVLAALAAHVTA